MIPSSGRGPKMPMRALSPALATADFVEACSGLVVTPEQRRYLQWFAETMDQPTLNAFADVIRLARAEQPPEGLA